MPVDSSLDPYAILRALGVQTIHTVVPVAGGFDTAIWRVEHDQVTSALRVFRVSQGPTYLRELAAMETAAQHGIPVPSVRAHGYWNERPVLLLSWCEGVPLAAALRRQPWRFLRLGRQFGEMQAKIHGIQGVVLNKGTSADWITWHNAIDSDLETLLRTCASSSSHLLHLDYHSSNVMVNHRGVSGVLDWANARGGDPRADVARTYTILVVEPHYPEPERAWYRVIRRLLAQTWLRGYQDVAGELSAMPMFFAWAGAAMCADLAPRVQNPNSWWQPQHLHLVEQWTQQWRRQVGDAAAAGGEQ